jgi:hypothetical protein
MYVLVRVDSTQFTAHWNKSEIPLSKKIALYDTVPLLLESNALSRSPTSNLLVLSPMLANNGYLQSEQM